MLTAKPFEVRPGDIGSLPVIPNTATTIELTIDEVTTALTDYALRERDEPRLARRVLLQVRQHPNEMPVFRLSYWPAGDAGTVAAPEEAPQ